MDPNIKQSIVDRLKQTNNVLVTVKSNPTVDQLAACIGLTLFLNKQGKHATAVFSGAVPSTIEFLKPESTLEKDTNSLRDFIISLDKSKADKLRYKVEDKVVKIFITPYRTSLSQDDLDFSQGDFNVDVVLALGVHVREELDQAIMAHGRILHDATVVSINNSKPADLGALNWNDPKASSLSEMVSSLVELLQPNMLDAQMATAFLTGIVAETDRFSNPKTTSVTMSLSAKLMAAGANQQLVATKLQEPVNIASPAKQKAGEDGELEIDHPVDKKQDMELPLPAAEGDSDSEIHIDDQGNFKTGLQDEKAKDESGENTLNKPSRMALEPPTMGGSLTANTQANQLDPSIDPLSGKSPSKDVLSHNAPAAIAPLQPAEAHGIDINPTQTLSSIEEQVDSPHAIKSPHEGGLKPLSADKPSLSDLLSESSSTEDNAGGLGTQTSGAIGTSDQGLDYARQAVEEASQSSMNTSLEPIQGLNSQILGDNLNKENPDLTGQPINPADTPLPPANQPGFSLDLPPNLVPPNSPIPTEQSGIGQPATSPPPVPPPMMPPNFGQPSQNSDDFNVPM